MNECHGEKFVLNGVVLPAASFNNSLVYEGDSIYEVIRMMNGTPVFFDDHMERFSSSLKLMSKEPLADSGEIRNAVKALTAVDRISEGNLKIVFNYKDESRNWIVYFIEPIYPTEDQYQKGVKGILFHAERLHPESKVINHRLRSEIYHRLILEGAYEALLVNKLNMITEGSRSNIFFLKGEILVTAPDNMVLGGITRKHILDICKENSIKVELRCVPAGEISDYDSVFMTGTSPMVLPFSRIENINFRVDIKLIGRLRTIYKALVNESIRSFRAE